MYYCTMVTTVHQTIYYVYIQYIQWYITCINTYACIIYTACIYTCHGVMNRKMKQKYIREGIKRRSNPKSSRSLRGHSTRSRGQLYTQQRTTVHIAEDNCTVAEDNCTRSRGQLYTQQRTTVHTAEDNCIRSRGQLYTQQRTTVHVAEDNCTHSRGQLYTQQRITVHTAEDDCTHSRGRLYTQQRTTVHVAEDNCTRSRGQLYT